MLTPKPAGLHAGAAVGARQMSVNVAFQTFIFIFLPTTSTIMAHNNQRPPPTNHIAEPHQPHIESISIAADPSMAHPQQSQPDAQSTPHVVDPAVLAHPPPPSSETTASSLGNETAFEHRQQHVIETTATGLETTTCSSADIFKMRALGHRGDRSPTVSRQYCRQ